ncbi:MAG: glycoside hydrolase family 3 N-terminal domain-containing protein [Calditrichia bacterium]
MLKFQYLMILLILVTQICATGNDVEKKVEQVLSQMTIEEKVGQMTQITLQVVTKQKGWGDKQFVVDTSKLEEAILHYNVGSILNVYNEAMTEKEWVGLITLIQDIATKKSRLKIPILYGLDAIHGVNYLREGTLFPQAIAMAAARDPEAVKQAAKVTALELRAIGVPWNFNPVLGVGRHPAWPRLFETFGEDPYLVTVMGEAYVKGMEGDNNSIGDRDKVASCMKHYLGYSFPLSGEDRTPAWIPERMLREIFLPPFKKAVEAGSHTIMINSSEINGIPVHSDHRLLTEILKEQLKFEGFVVSDWRDILNLHDRDHVADSYKEAVRMAVNAGVDMSMVPFDYSFYHDLLELVKEGKVSTERINDAVRRILTVKVKLGLFEDPYPVKELSKKIHSDESVEISYKAASKAITLLKNKNNMLPLSKDTKILVAGPTAHLRMVLNGGWSYTWQGDQERLYPKSKLTVLEAMQKEFGDDNISFFDMEKQSLDELMNVSKNTDVIVLCLGEMPYCETPGNIHNLMLPDDQLELVAAASKTDKPIVSVFLEGRPRIFTPVKDHMDAILLAYLPGPEGSRAIADVLSGDVNPSGKLPYTYPSGPNDLVTYDHKWIERTIPDSVSKIGPLFEFGFGLSYTTFKYSELELSKEKISPDEDLTITVKVKNIGKREGREVVELYLSDLYRTVSPSVRQLKRFKEVYLKPGEEQQVTFKIGLKDLIFWSRNAQWIAEPGEFIITIGDQKKSFYLISDKSEILVNEN